MIELKQSTAVDVVVGCFVDDTDGKTPETALTLSQADCLLSKNGGATAQKNDATSATHLAGGHYKVPLNTTDTNTKGHLRLIINESGALPVWQDFMVLSAEHWDAKYGSAPLATQASVNTVDDFLDTEIAAIKAKTDNLPASPAAVGDIPSAATVADAVWDEARSGHVTAGSFGEGVLVQTVNANALNTNSFSTGCISAAAIAANAIGATELAADAVTEIVDGVWANATRTLTADTNINYPSAATVAAAVLAAGDIDGYTLEQFGKLCLAALVGKLSGAATTTNTVRAADDSKDRITATVDADGNRTAVTLDAAG